MITMTEFRNEVKYEVIKHSVIPDPDYEVYDDDAFRSYHYSNRVMIFSGISVLILIIGLGMVANLIKVDEVWVKFGVFASFVACLLIVFNCSVELNKFDPDETTSLVKMTYGKYKTYGYVLTSNLNPEFLDKVFYERNKLRVEDVRDVDVYTYRANKRY